MILLNFNFQIVYQAFVFSVCTTI